MGRSLLVFIGSPNVGPYINAMANAVVKYDVDSITLVNIVESPSGQQVDFETFANKVLWDTLCGLVEGVYKELKRGSTSYQETSVPEASKSEAYKKLKHVFGNDHSLAKVCYPFLTEDIEKLKNTKGPDVIIDLSGVPKRASIDVLTACLAVGITDVMLFELEVPSSGVQTLYHNLQEKDYTHVVLPRWEPLIDNIRYFSARQNRNQLLTTVISILVSLALIVGYQFVRIRYGEGNWSSWLLIVAISVIGLVGGVTPIVNVWGGKHFVLGGSRKKRIS